jgi:hypothetical protein
MRPTVCFLAGCLCSLLLAGRIPSLFSASGNSGASSAVSPTTSAKHETRIERLQHYRLAAELLDRELRKLEELAKQQKEQADALGKAVFRERLSKELQATFDRMYDRELYRAWLEHAVKSLPTDKQAELEDQERKRVKTVDAKNSEYAISLLNQEGETYKTLMKRYEELPWKKEARMQNALVEVLTRERDEARAALLRD